MIATAPLVKLPTGVPGLDNLLLGGIPKGRATLIAGRSGTGKTVVAMQIAASLVRAGVPTLVLAVEESPSDLAQTGDSLGLDISGLCESRALTVSDLNRPDDGPVVQAGEYDVFGLVHRVEALVKSSKARAVILDSATALFSPTR